MTDLKVVAGDPLSAQRWNRIVDRLPTPSTGFGVGNSTASRSTIRIKNVGADNAELGELLALGDYDGITENMYDADKELAFEATKPTWLTDATKLVVAAEPIPMGEYGEAVVSGLCLVRLAADTDGDFVMVDETDPSLARSATGGLGRLLGKFTANPGDPVYIGVVNWRDGSNLWHFELTENSLAPATTKAKLLNLDDTEFATEIDLSDTLSVYATAVTGYRGVCMLAGSRFEPVDGGCDA